MANKVLIEGEARLEIAHVTEVYGRKEDWMAKWIGRRIVPAVLAITVVLATMSVCFAQSKPFGDLKPYVPTEQQLQPSCEEYLKQGLKNLDATPPVVSAQARRADASEAETLQFIRAHYAGTYESFKEGGFARSTIEDITLDSSD